MGHVVTLCCGCDHTLLDEVNTPGPACLARGHIAVRRKITPPINRAIQILAWDSFGLLTASAPWFVSDQVPRVSSPTKPAPKRVCPTPASQACRLSVTVTAGALRSESIWGGLSSAIAGGGGGRRARQEFRAFDVPMMARPS